MPITPIVATAEAVNEAETYRTELNAGDHHFIADEPVVAGGNDAGPSPGDYLCAALASCKAITIRMYAQRKGWTVGQVHVKVTLVKSDQASSGRNTFHCAVKCAAPLDEEQARRIVEIAKACPVSRLLGKESDVITLLGKS